MTIAQMVVFNDFVYRTITEVIAQQVQLFNAAVNNAIILRAGSNVGDYSDEAMFAEISGLIRRRDPYATGAVSPVNLSMLQHTSVKVAGGTPPIAFDPTQFTWIQQKPEVAGVVIGEQFAKAQFGDYLNTALKALRAALVGQTSPDVNYTVPSQGTLTLAALNEGARLFGDQAQQLRCWVMHSSPLHDLYGTALTNSETLFEFGNVKVQSDGFGRTFVVTDSPSLYGSVSSPDVTDYYTLGLVEGAALVEDNKDFFANLETSNGDENINRTWQAEYSFNLGHKGYAWDKTTGGKAPTDAELATGGNWDKIATSIKNTAGVAVRSR
jgi:hypothetical protein